MQSENTNVRWMARIDIPSVLHIEGRTFDYPWSESDLCHWISRRNAICMVAEQEREVVGFMLYEILDTQYHIINFAVDREFRRQGVGGAMVRRLMDKMTETKRNRVSLEVRETNLAAQYFFKSAGFRAIRVLRGLYEGSNEDAYLMQYTKPRTRKLSDECVSEKGVSVKNLR